MKKVLLLTIGIIVFSLGYSQTQHSTQLHKIEKNGMWGYADDKGNEIVQCKYLAIGEFGEEGFPVRAKKTEGQWTYVDRNGKEITGGVTYNHAYPFYESDLALVESGNRFGYIDKQGTLIIGLIYQKAYPFSDGLAAVKKANGKKYGFIDTKGEVVIKPSFDDVKWGFIDGTAWVKKGNKWGVIDKSGKTVVGFNYIRLNSFNPGTGVADAVSKDAFTHFYIKDKKYTSEKERNAVLVPPPVIIWPTIPSTTEQPQFVLNVNIKSDSKIEFFKVYLNDEEVEEQQTTGGSSIVEDSNGKDYNITVRRKLVLNDGINIIRIKVKNAGGETEEQKTIVKEEIAKVLIAWKQMLPTVTSDQGMNLELMVLSTVKDVSCRVLLNGIEAPKTKGSSIVEDLKESEYKYKLEVQRMLTLKDGDNMIVIEVKDARGKLLSSDEKHVDYTKPTLATIAWGEVPTTTEEEQFSLRALVKSDSEIEYCHVTFNGTQTKGSRIVRDNYNLQVIETFNLKEGDNLIKIEVKNKGGEKAEEKKINYTPKEKRIALVIGNAKYQNIRFPKLPKTKADAQTMYDLLESYGFVMMPLVLDADLDAMRDAINGFVDEVGRGNYDVALLYFSGHGLSPDGGANYLIPIDANIEYTDEVKHNAINSKTELITRLEDKNCRVEIVLLDCCNDCALAERGTKGAYDGHMAPVNPKPYGISIIHAALPGKKALEGEGKNSPFVESFVKCTKNHPNVDWESLINAFIYDVQIRTNNYQTPFPEGRIIGRPFYINLNRDK